MDGPLAKTLLCLIVCAVALVGAFLFTGVVLVDFFGSGPMRTWPAIGAIISWSVFAVAFCKMP
jgi:hypothetical protein